MAENQPCCVRRRRFNSQFQVGFKEKKFCFAAQRDAAQIRKRAKFAQLTMAAFRGISSRACGPCRTAPAASHSPDCRANKVAKR
jgi:hydroxypyruvate isomerase